MRIISKFKDYYDSASSFGIDLERVYNREQKEIEIKKISGNTALKKYPNFRSNVRGYTANQNNKITDVEAMVLGFCGQMIPLVKVSYKAEQNQIYSDREHLFFYDFNSYINFLKEHNLKFSGYFSHYSFRNEVSFDILHEQGAKEFFNYRYGELQDIFAEHHTPLFLYINEDHGYEQKILINPKLKDIHFGKIKDAASCFQEIFMYISGVLGNVEKDLIQISDKDMLKQKGFDNYSFKKLPTKHK
jgi:hypothetical protein